MVNPMLVTVLVALDALAVRFGTDSRETFASN